MPSTSIKTRRRQTTAPHGHGILSLSASFVFSKNTIPGRDIIIIPKYMSRIGTVIGYQGDGANGMDVIVANQDDTTPFSGHGGDLIGPIDLTGIQSQADLITAANAVINSFATGNGYSFSKIVWPWALISDLPTAPSSYQTIVSQTGTAAPAVSGSLTPTSTYPSGTTFTWARTGAGVYTLTASTAVFNTSGKTGVFVGSLNNLNASYKTVVTSSTVITITTAIGSLLGLGLLGFTATNTDALLSNTMIYVQTYA